MWYRKSAETGHVKAQYEVGRVLYDGEGVGQNHDEATKWFAKAAAQGNASAQRDLGVAYAYGNGVPRDLVEGMKWATLAANQNETLNGECRDEIAKMMTPEQIAEAEKQAMEWKPLTG